LFEPKPGKSNALNSGIANARGEILAFMDDDVQVDAGWLNNLVEAIRDRACAGVGGRILPELGFVPTEWMDSTNPYGLAPLAVFDRGVDAAELNEPPFGTNMAFRREVFEKYGGFRTDLGPRPGTEIRNEDTEFGARLLSAGEHLWYEPAAVVYHSIPKNRVRREYFQAWWFDKGRANIREDGVPNDSKRRIAGIPTYLLRRIAVWVARWITGIRSRDRFSAKLKVWCLAGQIAECHRQAHQV
jgi:GT2 family glycosyltransferase